MTTNSERPRAESGAFQEDQRGGDVFVALKVQHGSDSTQQGLSLEDFRARRTFEANRRALALDIVRTHLGEQPSPRTMRSCARRWADDIRHIAETLIKAREADA